LLLLSESLSENTPILSEKTVIDALYDRPKLAPQLQTIEGINNILTQMDGQQKINQNAFCYNSGVIH
jgi:hypothetical protein